MSRGLDVEGQHVRAGVDVGADLFEWLLNHEVDVLPQPRLQGPDHRRTEGQLRTKAAVHDVEVDVVGAGVLDPRELIAHVHPVGHGDTDAEPRLRSSRSAHSELPWMTDRYPMPPPAARPHAPRR